MKQTADKTNGDRGIKIVRGEEYWTSSKAAEYLNISRAGLHNLKKRGKIGFLKHGGRILYKKEWLDEYLNESTSFGFANRRQK